MVATHAAEALLAQSIGLLAATGVAVQAALIADAPPSGQVAGGAELGHSRCQQPCHLGDVLLARWGVHGA